MKFPDEPRHGESVMDTVVALLRWCRANNVVGCSNGFVQETPNGKIIICAPPAPPAAAADSAGALSCPFGDIVTWMEGDTPKTGIKGGVIICGKETWNMDNTELNLTANGEWLIYYEVTAEVNRDDDNEILLPGVKTGTKPDGLKKTVKTDDADYPTGDPPDVSSGKGKIILPLGILKIKDGAAVLTGTGCGNFTIEHCSGTLSYSR